jgi:hypothetical protein
MSDKDQTVFKFTTVDEFNSLTNHVISNAYDEFVKLTKYFEAVSKSAGADSFSTSVVVFNTLKKLIGVVTSRPVLDKADMYKALAQMLYFPMSVDSDLFIVAQDARIRTLNSDMKPGDIKSDAFIVTYVTPESCIIFTVPYQLDSNNEVIWNYDDAFITSINDEMTSTADSPVGDMIELFYVFSHAETTGPFSPHEVLFYFKNNEFSYEIINEENMGQDLMAIPIVM